MKLDFTRLANEIKLGDYIFISTAEERNKGRTKLLFYLTLLKLLWVRFT